MSIRIRKHHLDNLTEPQKSLVYSIIESNIPGTIIWAVKMGALLHYLEHDDKLTKLGKRVAKNTIKKITEKI